MGSGRGRARWEPPWRAPPCAVIVISLALLMRLFSSVVCVNGKRQKPHWFMFQFTSLVTIVMLACMRAMHAASDTMPSLAHALDSSEIAGGSLQKRQ